MAKEIKPITPSEAKASKIALIPDAIIQATNQLISENLELDGSATVLQKDIAKLACQLDNKLTSERIYAKNLMDIEPYYREAGWKVVYDKPAYCENYDANFTFTPKFKS